MPYLILLLFLFGFLFWGFFAGGAPLTFQDVLASILSPFGLSQSPQLFQTIIWQIRLPRMITSFFCGASLALAGVVSQAVFRNPLADPFIVGTSAGASFAVTMAIVFNIIYIAPGVSALPLFAFLGAVLVTLLVLLLGRKGGSLPVGTLILAGVAANYFFVSLGSLASVVGRNVLNRTMLWSLEGFAGASWSSALTVLPYFLIGFALLYFLAKPLNLILLGEEGATGMGLNVERFKFLLILLIGLLTGAAVSVSGLIGFVGLIVPHISRLIVGANHKRLLPMASLAGGVLLLGADNLARSIIPGIEIPVAVITALLGVPFFLYLLRKK